MSYFFLSQVYKNASLKFFTDATLLTLFLKYIKINHLRKKFPHFNEYSFTLIIFLSMYLIYRDKNSILRKNLSQLSLFAFNFVCTEKKHKKDPVRIVKFPNLNRFK